MCCCAHTCLAKRKSKPGDRAEFRKHCCWADAVVGARPSRQLSRASPLHSNVSAKACTGTPETKRRKTSLVAMLRAPPPGLMPGFRNGMRNVSMSMQHTFPPMTPERLSHLLRVDCTSCIALDQTRPAVIVCRARAGFPCHTKTHARFARASWLSLCSARWEGGWCSAGLRMCRGSSRPFQACERESGWHVNIRNNFHARSCWLPIPADLSTLTPVGASKGVHCKVGILVQSWSLSVVPSNHAHDATVWRTRGVVRHVVTSVILVSTRVVVSVFVFVPL